MLNYSKLKQTDAADIQRLVGLYAAAFFKWRTKGRRSTLPIEKAFKAWWIGNGPTRVPVTDIGELKRDILAEILAVRNDKPETA